MKLRRYYPKGFSGKTFSDEYLNVLEVKGAPIDQIDTASYELILTPEEQRVFFTQSCDLILTKTRWVLDNLEWLTEYKVGWESYRKRNRKLYKQKITE